MQVPSQPASRAGRIPDELMQRFHDANARFHESRARLDVATAGVEYRHEERVGAALNEIRQAERVVEEVEGEISRHIDGPAH